MLRFDRQVEIKCWRGAGEQVLLFELKHKQLLSLECTSFAGSVIAERSAVIRHCLGARSVSQSLVFTSD